MKQMNYIMRRSFLSIALLLGAGIMTSNYLDALASKPKSKFAGVQVGTITYSFRSMPHDVDQLIQFLTEANVSAIELMGDPAETYAGKPASPVRMGPPPAGGQRPQMTDEQRAQIAD